MKNVQEGVYNRLVEHIIENQKKFYRIAFCYVYQKEAAMDIIQNAICKALENYQGLKNDKAIKTWFYRILINECLQYFNKHKKETVCDPFELKEDIYYEEAYEPESEVYALVCSLPEQMKTIVMLHFYEQMTLKEISKTIDVNLNTVKTRLYAALQRLKKEMEEEA